MKQNSISQLNKHRWIWVHTMSIATVFYILLFTSLMNDTASKNIVIHLPPQIMGATNEESIGLNVYWSANLQHSYF